MDELHRISVEEFKQTPKLEVVLVLDNVRSALNVGSAFRTADAFGIERIVLCGITAQPPHKEIAKTALGATQSVAWTHAPHTVHALQTLKAQGYQLIGVEQVSERIGLHEFVAQVGSKYAIVFGNEVDGISDDALPLLDTCVEIAQFGTKHSINVAVCIGVVAWEFTKQLRFAGGHPQ